MAYKKGTPSDLKRRALRERDKLPKAVRDTMLGPGVTKSTKKGAGAGNGGPAYIIDKEKLEALAGTMCSYDEMSLILGVDVDFLHAHYKSVIQKAQANGKSRLRAVQFANAVGGNVIMQIWLGKQLLDQKDTTRVEQSGPDGKPIEHKQMVAYIPENNRDRR